MSKAIEEVTEGKTTCYKASKKYHIPDQTLRDRLSGKTAITAKPGRPIVLTVE